MLIEVRTETGKWLGGRKPLGAKKMVRSHLVDPSHILTDEMSTPMKAVPRQVTGGETKWSYFIS
ncbi:MULTISPECIES: hypothetical protein [Geobacillus]|uniref:hypothetical protein n=1 Tax=Geobacillus TaxID=129337 RepID=UPI000358774F|nr:MULTISPECIES: hypothetical protein [Geobacillus]EPR27467.1 hypothetical protein I656_02896 [Geobacillus sp. WSUCF1]